MDSIEMFFRLILALGFLKCKLARVIPLGSLVVRAVPKWTAGHRHVSQCRQRHAWGLRGTVPGRTSFVSLQGNCAWERTAALIRGGRGRDDGSAAGLYALHAGPIPARPKTLDKSFHCSSLLPSSSLSFPPPFPHLLSRPYARTSSVASDRKPQQ